MNKAIVLLFITIISFNLIAKNNEIMALSQAYRNEIDKNFNDIEMATKSWFPEMDKILFGDSSYSEKKLANWMKYFQNNSIEPLLCRKLKQDLIYSENYWNKNFLSTEELHKIYYWQNYFLIKLVVSLNKNDGKQLENYIKFLQFVPPENKNYSSRVLKKLIVYSPFWNNIPYLKLNKILDELTISIMNGYHLNRSNNLKKIAYIEMLKFLNKFYSTGCIEPSFVVDSQSDIVKNFKYSYLLESTGTEEICIIIEVKNIHDGNSMKIQYITMKDYNYFKNKSILQRIKETIYNQTLRWIVFEKTNS